MTQGIAGPPLTGTCRWPWTRHLSPPAACERVVWTRALCVLCDACSQAVTAASRCRPLEPGAAVGVHACCDSCAAAACARYVGGVGGEAAATPAFPCEHASGWLCHACSAARLSRAGMVQSSVRGVGANGACRVRVRACVQARTARGECALTPHIGRAVVLPTSSTVGM